MVRLNQQDVDAIIQLVRDALKATDDDATLDDIQRDRQEVYGDPLENHKGIAMAWAGLLQPHAEAIAKGDPIPSSSVALMMVALKLNRMRRVYHKDNYDDLRVYLGFAEEWQQKGL